MKLPHMKNLLSKDMKDYDTSFRILEDPLMVVGIGVAFAKADDGGICEQISKTLEEMRQDGTSLKIIGKYLDDPQKYLDVDKREEQTDVSEKSIRANQRKRMDCCKHTSCCISMFCFGGDNLQLL